MSIPPALKEALQDPESALELDLSGEDLKVLPAAIGALRHLQTLDIERNPIRKLPQELWSLKNLESLSFSTVDDSVPDQIGTLRKLRVLSISRWSDKQPKATHLPSTLASLKNLEEFTSLDLVFSEFPKVLCRLPSLQVVRVIGGELGELPSCIGEMVELTRLALARAGVRAIPAAVAGLRKLEQLDISYAPALSSLPAELGTLKRLRTLMLRNCGFTQVPECVAKLAKLKSLGFSGNPLTEFPRLKGLTQLKHLYLDECRLTDLPQEVWDLPNLEFVSLTGNTFTKEGYARAKAAQRRKIEVEMPRAGTVARVKRQAEKHLSPKVLLEIRRLGVKEKASLNRAPEVAKPADKSYPLPEPLRELVYKCQFRGLRVDVELPELSGAVRLSPQADDLSEYEVFSNRPYLQLGDTEQHSLILIALDDPSPSDPTLYYLDVDDYTATEARDLGVRLSTFLKAAKPSRSKVKA